MLNSEHTDAHILDGLPNFGPDELTKHTPVMLISKNRRKQSAMCSESIVRRLLESPDVKVIYTCGHTMDSISGCFRWVVQSVKDMDTEIHRLSKLTQPMNTL
jgi:hypothetical protein